MCQIKGDLLDTKRGSDKRTPRKACRIPHIEDRSHKNKIYSKHFLLLLSWLVAVMFAQKGPKPGSDKGPHFCSKLKYKWVHLADQGLVCKDEGRGKEDEEEEEEEEEIVIQEEEK